MKAYKAFNRDMTCRGFQYKEGEIYEIEDKPKLCQRGFHFCKDLVLTLGYYPCKEITDNKYAEVEVLGDTEFEEPTHHKGVTNKIKIIRVLLDSEVLAMVDSDSNSGDCNSGYNNSGDRNSGDSNSGDSNSGNSNFGYNNSGNSNSGYSNSGDNNSGYNNSGDSNSGYCNSGNNNSGYRNSGGNNSGDRNSGNSNSGYNNSGNSNSGNWNSASNETGFFNTKNPETINVFNRQCKIEDWENANKPGFIYFEIDPELGYRGSWQKAFKSAPKEEIKKLKALPNFDKDVFYDLTGIKI